MIGVKACREHGSDALLDYSAAISEGVPYAQGDVVRSFIKGITENPEFGVIITADCDIVQSKASERLTYVQVVSPLFYLEQVWIPDQLNKFLKKQGPLAAEGISAVARRAGLPFQLNADEIVEWLALKPVAEIAKLITHNDAPLEKRLVQTLEGLRCVADTSAVLNPLMRWRMLRSIMGDTEDRQKSDLAAALYGGGGFSDSFLLPELPGVDGIGYVALLRFIRTVHSSDIYSSELQARIEGRPDALHRVGRLSDNIRFSIAQKMAFLFSRIGLPSNFEDNCRSAASLSVEHIISGV